MKTKKKIFIIVDSYFPKSKKIQAQMAEELAIGIKRRGHNVIIIAPDDSHDTSKDVHIINEVNVKFFKNPKIKDIGFIRRAVNEFLLPFNAFFRLRGFVKNNKPEFIIYFSPSIFFGLYVLYLKISFKVETYLVLRDMFPQWVVDLGLIKKNRPPHIFFKIFERINYFAASTIGLESPSGLAEFKLDFKKYNSELLLNWIEDKRIPIKKRSLRADYGLQNKIIFFYGGTIGVAQDISNIINLAKSFKNEKKAHFVLIGDGNEFMTLKKESIKLGLQNLTISQGVDPEVYIDYLQEIDIGLISLNKNNTGNNIPGKLLNYMKLKKPILGSVNSGNDIINIINDSNAGLISSSNDSEAFLENAYTMLLESNRVFFAENSFKLMLEKFSIDSALDNILKYKK
tara:strand:- start:357 stop:1553 length:1197 start_codon:yes stop_codon:yes gene_type:complete